MPYNPALPANNAPVVAAELRNQFSGLNELIDGLPQGQTMTDVLNLMTAGSVVGVEPLSFMASNPPTKLEVDRIVGKVNEIIALLKRE